MVVEGSDRDGVDVDYTFGQVAVDEVAVDSGGIRGNPTSVIGVLTIDGGPVTVDAGVDSGGHSLHNTKLVRGSTKSSLSRTAALRSLGVSMTSSPARLT